MPVLQAEEVNRQAPPPHQHTHFTPPPPPSREAEVLVQAVADVVAIQQRGEVAALVQQVLQSAGHRRLAAAAQACSEGGAGRGGWRGGGLEGMAAFGTLRGHGCKQQLQPALVRAAAAAHAPTMAHR